MYGKPRTSHRIGYCSCQRQFYAARWYANTCRIPDTINVERRVDYQRTVENISPNVASIRKFNGVSWERKESRWWVLHVCGDVVGVVAGGGFAIEVIEKRLAGAN